MRGLILFSLLILIASAAIAGSDPIVNSYTVSQSEISGLHSPENYTFDSDSLLYEYNWWENVFDWYYSFPSVGYDNYIADDFEVSSHVQLTSLKVCLLCYGTQPGSNMDVYIFADDPNDGPGDVIAYMEDCNTDWAFYMPCYSDSFWEVTIDIDCELDPGTYWISAHRPSGQSFILDGMTPQGQLLHASADGMQTWVELNEETWGGDVDQYMRIFGNFGSELEPCTWGKIKNMF